MHPIFINAQLIKFIIVGILNAAFGYTCYYALLWYGLHFSSALLISTIIGVLFNFKSLGLFVFNSSDNYLITKFVTGYVVVYGINMAGIQKSIELGLSPEMGGALLILPMAALSFLINKKFVFKK